MTKWNGVLRFVARGSLVCLALFVTGCGGASKPPDFLGNLSPVTGTVKIDGVPVAGVQVTFLPRQGMGTQNDPKQGRLASGTTDSEGVYTLVTPPGGPVDPKDLEKFSGAVPAKYVATFSLWIMPDGQPWAASGKTDKGPMASGATEKLPPQLGNPQTSPHPVEVKEGENTFDFDIKSK